MMTMLLYGILVAATTGTIVSLLLLLRYRPSRGAYAVSLRHFTLLVLVYITVILSFSILYLGLELLGVHVLIEANHPIQGPMPHMLEDIIYFSAVTLLSVGYGDLVPIGVGRFIAVIQALFGYLLPAAFVVTTVIHVKSKGG